MWGREEEEGKKEQRMKTILSLCTLGLPFLSAGSGCILVFFGLVIWGELAASVSMLRGVAGREDGRGVSAIEFFLESDGGGFTLDTKEGRERGGKGERREGREEG